MLPGEQNAGTAGTGQQPILAGSKPREQNYFCANGQKSRYIQASIVSLLVTTNLLIEVL